MTASPGTAQPRPSFLDAAAVYFKPRVLIVLFLGFSSGLPLALSGTTLLVWMRESGVDLGTIGLFALVGTPYTVKFLWAPLTDALDVPLLSRWLGRRRGWLVFTQMLLMAAIVFLGSSDPARAPGMVALGALLVATASATQDIVVDAFRIESLPENEQAAGIGVLRRRLSRRHAGLDRRRAVPGQRLPGLRLRQAGGLALGLCGDGRAGADRHRHRAHRHRAGALGAGGGRRTPQQKPFARVAEAAVGAFKDFLSYEMAFVMLAFVVLFKFTDALSGAMTAPFVIDLGFTRNEYAAIVKGVGLAALLAGGFAGGFIARALPLATSLWIGAILQAAANLGFCWVAVRRPRSDRADRRHHAGEFHQRHRHGDVRRLSVGAVPEPAAHGDAIRAAHRARRRRPHLSVVGRRLHRRGDRLGVVLRDLRARRPAEPGAAGLAAEAGHFKRLEPKKATHSSPRPKGESIASDPPGSCVRKRPPPNPPPSE